MSWVPHITVIDDYNAGKKFPKEIISSLLEK